ncbi:saccharopine dehydrogenase [Nannochloropsis oceanica]
MATREFDVVIFGATGFTGQLVAEYYLRTYGAPSSSFNWAIAGRNQKKLQEIKKDLGINKNLPEAKDIKTLVANSNDSASLEAIAKNTKVVVTTVGPYMKYGSKLVAACAAKGTHYADLTGEVPWIKDMIAANEEKAKASGARILHCCGFDSVPSDLGTHVMYNALVKRGLTPTEIKFIVGPSKGGVSGGTVHSLAGVLQSGRLRDMGNPYLLLSGGKKGGRGGGVTVKEPMGVGWDRDVQRWNAPFVMAGINTRVVVRSSYLMDRLPFEYTETMSFPKGVGGFLSACALTLGLALVVTCLLIPPIRWLVLKMLPPGSGPGEEMRKTGFALIYVVGKGVDKAGKEVVLKGSVRIAGDPGYQETAKMLAETGMALAKDEVDAAPGFLTPASALGDKLVTRLKKRDLVVEVEGE